MKTREEILAIWKDQETYPDFEPTLREILEERDKFKARVEEAELDILWFVRWGRAKSSYSQELFLNQIDAILTKFYTVVRD